MSFINQYEKNIIFSQEFTENNENYIYFISTKIRFQNQFYITKTNINGDLIWSKEIIHSDSSYNEIELIMVQTGMDPSTIILDPETEFLGQYIIIPKFSDNATLNILSIDANGNRKWSRAYNHQEDGSHTQRVVANENNFFVLTSNVGEFNILYHTLSRFDTTGNLQQSVNLSGIIKANDIILYEQIIVLVGSFNDQAAIVQIDNLDFSIQKAYNLSSKSILNDIWNIVGNGSGQFALKLEISEGSFGIALIEIESYPVLVPILPPAIIYFINVGSDFSTLCISADSIYFTRDAVINRIGYVYNSVWKKEMLYEEGIISFNSLSYCNSSNSLTASSTLHSASTLDSSNGIIFHMDIEANTCLAVTQPIEIFQIYSFSEIEYIAFSPIPLRARSVDIRYSITDEENLSKPLCDSSGIDENGLIQSNCLYLQAAGSTGTDSSSGIHLRWMLKGPMINHLPKGNHYQNTASEFNKPNDFIKILRAPYNPVITKLSLNTAPNSVIDNLGMWLYELNNKSFYVYFRNLTKYQQLRSTLNPLIDYNLFIKEYGDNILEIETIDQLFFAIKLNFSEIISSGSVKIEVLSVETNKNNLPKHTTYRNDLSGDYIPDKIFSENGKSVRFAATDLSIMDIDFEFYSDFVFTTNNSSGWKDMGQYSLSTDDLEVFQRLDPDAISHPIHAVWPRYNGGEFVNIENYKNKWNGNLDDRRNQIKHSVNKYLTLSNDLLNPLANETYFLEDEEGNILDYENGLEISHLVILQMASLDYHVARMMGLGIIDFSNEVYSNQQYIYAAQYTTELDFEEGGGESHLTHISLSLPTCLDDKRESLAITLLPPIPGIFSANNEVENNEFITDEDGYTHDGEARYISIFAKELTPNESEDASFWSGQNLDMSKFTYPVYMGIEYKNINNVEWHSPELANDSEYQNTDSFGNISQNETIAISIPEYGKPAFIHRETKSGKHIYGSYGVNWFSRSKASNDTWEIETNIRASNRLLAPSNINTVLIQKEEPLLFTSENEQQIFSVLQGDKTFVRLTFEYDAAQEMITYLKKVNGQLVSDFSPLPNNQEIFTDEVDVFFRPEIPQQVFGKIESISELPTNPFISVIQSTDLPLYSTGNHNIPDSHQILSPVISIEKIPNFIGGIFKSADNEFVIHNIIIEDTQSLPIFHILKKQIGSPFGQSTSKPFDPADFVIPSINDSFMVVENMQNETSWGEVNPFPIKVKIGAPDWQIHTEEIISLAGQSPDVSTNTYYRKFRGINRNAKVVKFIDPIINEFQGVYKITLSGYILNNHPQYNPVIGEVSVQWYQGTVRISREGKENEERKILKVLRIDNNPIFSGNLTIYVYDETFIQDPIQLGNERITMVNFYPGYRVYLYKSDLFRLNENNIYSQDENILEKYSIFGLRSIDMDTDYKSPISTPALMFSRKILPPEIPLTPIGANYATKPDYFSRSTYAFITEFVHRPFSVTFLRSNDSILLTSLYKQTPYGRSKEIDSVEDILEKNNDLFTNDRLLDLANVNFDLATKLFKIYNGYGLPLPNNPQLFENINLFIQGHNEFYGEFLPPISVQEVNNMDYIIIQGHVSNKHGVYGTLTFGDFVKQTIQNTYVPLTEIPIIYQHIKKNDYEPISKSQVIRDRNGVLLNPSSTEFDMAPMAKIVNENPNQVLFVDFTLDGNSNSVYFYTVRESNSQMEQSALSPAVGPVKLINSYPLKTPEIRSVIPILQNESLISSRIQLEINSYEKLYNVKKIKLYRALSMIDSMSVRTMILIKEKNLENEENTDIEIWKISDDFIDLAEIPFGDPLFYRVVVEAEIEYAKAQYDGQQINIVTDYAPSEASRIMVTTMTENKVPDSPILSYTVSPASTSYILAEVKFTWEKQVYKGKYHINKMNAQGNWVEIAVIQSNEELISLNLLNTEWGSDKLTIEDAGGNLIYHHFKVITENTSGMMSVEEHILTIGK